MNLRSFFSNKKRGSKIASNQNEMLDFIKDQLSALQHLHQKRERAQSVYLGDHTALCRTEFGHKIYIDTRDISLAPHLAMDGKWEMWITEAMTRILRPGMTCVDLGTNFGWYSLLMADRAGESGCLIGADANVRMVDLCRRSLAINGYTGRSSIRHSAITDRDGEISFSALDHYMGSGSIKDMGDTATQFHDQARSITVPCQTLDRLTEKKPINFMKIDCEGAEPGIIRGGLSSLKSPDLQIFMEYAPGFYAPGEADNMIHTLSDLGFKFYAIETNSAFEPVSIESLLNLAGLSELYLKRG